MFVMCLKYMTIILIIETSLNHAQGKPEDEQNYHPGSNIISLHFKHIAKTVVIITDYKRVGYVIIPTPKCSSCESMNSRCRRLSCCFSTVLTQYDAVCLVAFPPF